VAAVPLLEPRGGVPTVVADGAGLARTVAAFAAGTGPVAVDAERASGYRYGQRAYLVQLRRAGAGTALIDPLGCPDLSALRAAIADAEWVLHAASQDLPCLTELGLVPARLFDTELAARLAGHPRVGLGAIVESQLGFVLAKEHSAVDWSRRPLPEPWVVYAALDVEVLIELRDALHAELARQGKLGWAEEEFAALLAAPPVPPRPEPWRRTSGIHRLRSRRDLGLLRAVWQVRDRIARERDIAPGRLLPDAALLAAVTAQPATLAELTALPVWRGRATRRLAPAFLGALDRASRLPPEALPEPSPPGDGPPPVGRWAERDPAAAARLAALRAAVTKLATEHRLPVENLLAPELVRRLAWTPSEPTDEAVAARLREGGARRWQVELTAAPLAAVLVQSTAAADEFS
jgi:ribonuclease D